MEKKVSILVTIGLVIYSASFLIDRFIRKIPDLFYIGLTITAIALILLGFYYDHKKNKK